MKKKFLVIKLELLGVLAYHILPILNLLFKTKDFISPNAIIVSFGGISFAYYKSLVSIVNKLIDKKPVEWSMNYETKVKNYRINQLIEMLPFFLISLSFTAILLLLSLMPFENAGIMLAGLFVGVMIGFFYFVKAFLKIIKGSE